MSNKIPVLNGVGLALGVWAAPCNNDKVSFGNEGLCSRGRHGEEDRRTEKGVCVCVREGGGELGRSAASRV